MFGRVQSSLDTCFWQLKHSRLSAADCYQELGEDGDAGTGASRQIVCSATTGTMLASSRRKFARSLMKSRCGQPIGPSRTVSGFANRLGLAGEIPATARCLEDDGPDRLPALRAMNTVPPLIMRVRCRWRTIRCGQMRWYPFSWLCFGTRQGSGGRFGASLPRLRPVRPVLGKNKAVTRAATALSWEQPPLVPAIAAWRCAAAAGLRFSGRSAQPVLGGDPTV